MVDKPHALLYFIEMMQLYLFGTLRVIRAGDSMTLMGNTAMLLGYLALQQYPQPRSQIAGTLFPDVSETQARRLLTHTLYRLRREIGTDSLLLDNDSIGLADVWVDVVAFESAARQGDRPKALQLYTADLLGSVDAAWLMGRRMQLREQYERLLAQQIAVYRAENNAIAALPLAQRWVQVNPLDEDAHVALMRLYHRLGKQRAALQQYNDLVALLATELAVEPLPETQAVAAELQAQSAVDSAENPPLIGRRNERAQLLKQLAQRGSISLLEGNAGIGKTHLLNDIAATLQWRDIHVGRAKTNQLVGEQLYEPLASAMQTVVRAMPESLTKLTPLARRLISEMLPQLRPQLAEPLTNTSPRALQMALRQLHIHLTTTTPLVLLFDDVQWADDGFWGLLPTLAELTQTLPLSLVLAFRSREMRANETGWNQLAAIDQQFAPLRLTLTGLAAAESAEFVQQHGYDPAASTVKTAIEISGGNPYLLQTLLAGDGTTEMTTLFDQRLAALSDAARQALAAASVLGGTISADVWHMMLEAAPPIHALLKSNIITPVDNGFAFEHDLLQLHVRQSLSDGARRQWHQRAAAVLAQQATAATLAWHEVAAGNATSALHHYQTAFETALMQHNLAMAQTFVTRAVALHDDLDEGGKLVLQLMQLQIAEAHRYSGENLDKMATLAASAKRLGDAATLLRILRLQLGAYAAQGELDVVRSIGAEAIQLAGELGDLSAEITIYLAVANKIIVIERNVVAAMSWIDHALTLAEQPDAPLHLQVDAWLQKLSARARLPDRTASELFGYHARAAAIVAQHDALRPLETDLQLHHAIAAQMTGDFEQAWRDYCQVVMRYQQDGSDRMLRSARYNAANMSMVLGQHVEAVLFAEDLLQTELQQTEAGDQLYVNQFRALLIRAYVEAGEHAIAEQEAARLLEWLASEPAGSTVVYAWNTIGVLHFHKGAYATAYEAHQRALALESPTMAIPSATYQHLAENCCRLGKLAEARRYLDQVAAQDDLSQINGNGVSYYYIEHLISAELAPLATARRMLHTLAKRIKAPKLRHDFLYQLSLHRDIELAWRRAAPAAQAVTLTASEHPLGKAITPADQRTITWTVDAGDGQSFSSKVALRQHRLRQLVAEADIQGVLPTQQDLADALGVAVRTIQRDMAALTAAGTPLQTRK